MVENPRGPLPEGRGGQPGFLSRVARECGFKEGEGELTIRCALTPVYESRAVGMVGRSGVETIKRVAERVRREMATEPDPFGEAG